MPVCEIDVSASKVDTKLASVAMVVSNAGSIGVAFAGFLLFHAN